MRVVAISQDPPAATREFQERHGAHVEVAYDAAPWPASERLGVTTVPTFFRVGPDGTIEEMVEGWNRERMLGFARRGAVLAGRESGEIIRPGDQVPSFKPG